MFEKTHHLLHFCLQMTTLQLHGGPTSTDATEFRKIIGAHSNM